MAALDEVHGWLERELPSLLHEYGVPAASVAVMVGEQRRTVASGVLNLETGVEATTDAVFQIGSVTKVFTATLIMQLVDEGLLSLDDTVQSVLPGFRVADAVGYLLIAAGFTSRDRTQRLPDLLLKGGTANIQRQR